MTVSDVKLDTKQAMQYARYMQQAPEIARKEMKISLTEALLFLEREVKDGTPTGVGSGGGLRGSITHNLRGSTARHLRGRVFSPLAYAIPVEFGTKPHWAPIDPIQDWVEAKLGVPANESREVAFRVALKISREGTDGAHMFENAFSDNTQQLMDMLSSGIDRLFEQLGNAK